MLFVDFRSCIFSSPIVNAIFGPYSTSIMVSIMGIVVVVLLFSWLFISFSERI